MLKNVKLQNLCTYGQNWPIKHKADTNGIGYDNCHDMKANQVGVLFCISRTGLWGYHLCLTNWCTGTWGHLPTLMIQLSWQWTGQSWQRQWVLFSPFISSTMTGTNWTSVGSWNYGWLLTNVDILFFHRSTGQLTTEEIHYSIVLQTGLSSKLVSNDIRCTVFLVSSSNLWKYLLTSPVLLWQSHKWNM